MTDDARSQTRIFERFLEFEERNGLFSIRVDGAPVWERIRFDVHRAVLEKADVIGTAHTEVVHDVRNYLKGVSLLARNLVSKNPFFSGESDVVFVGHPRRKRLEDGYWWDIYCDPIYESLSVNSVHLERPYQNTHRKPAKTENLRYLDCIEYSGTLNGVVGVFESEMDSGQRSKLRAATEDLRSEFGVEIDLLAEAEDTLRRRRVTKPLYSRLFRRIDPNAAVVLVSYGRESLIEACQELGIPVVELQHGVIHENHLGYSYSGYRTKETFPDYLFTFGEFWNDIVEFPIPGDRILPVGYPHLERSVEQYSAVESEDKILFISQGTIGEWLSKFALEVDHHQSIDHDVVYKLHPGEYGRWMEEYPWLAEADFEVIGDSDRQLYRLFAESSVQVGVGSTAIYEGLCFDLDTYIYECSGAEALQPLIDEGLANSVSSVAQLSRALGRENTHFDHGHIFAPNSGERICDALQKNSTN